MSKCSTHVAILQNISEYMHFITIILLPLMISLYCPNLSNKTCKIRRNETKSRKGSPEKMKPLLGRPALAQAQQQRAKGSGGSTPSGTT